MHLRFDPHPATLRDWVETLAQHDGDALNLIWESTLVSAWSASSERVGALWYFWIDPETLGVHVALTKAARWTAEAVGDVHKIPELIGASRLIAPPMDKPALRDGLLMRVGWQRSSDGLMVTALPSKWSAYRDGKDSPGGLRRGQQAKVGDDPGASGKRQRADKRTSRRGASRSGAGSS